MALARAPTEYGLPLPISAEAARPRLVGRMCADGPLPPADLTRRGTAFGGGRGAVAVPNGAGSGNVSYEPKRVRRRAYDRSTHALAVVS